MRQLFLLMRQGQQREGNLQSVAAAPSQRAATRPRYQINVTNSRRFIASPEAQDWHSTRAYLDEVPGPICGDASDTHAMRCSLFL